MPEKQPSLFDQVAQQTNADVPEAALEQDVATPEPTSAADVPTEFRNPYATQDGRREAIIETRDGEDLAAEQTGFRGNVAAIRPTLSDADNDAINATQRRHPSAGRRPAPNTGPVPGESESDTGPPDYHRPVPPRLTDAEKVVGLEGVRETRDELARIRRGEQTPPSA